MPELKRSTTISATRTALFLLGCMLGSAIQAQAENRVVEISNPYANVNWETDGPLRGNLHTHTTQSDGRQDPDAVIDEYEKREYDFLAITDHNRVTYPWQDFGRDPETVGMTDIEGNELSRGHHIVSLFSDYASRERSASTLFRGVADKGGIAYFAHPGRYNHDAQWYADLYHDNPHVFGQAIYNQGDRYPEDRQKWDNVLSITMPVRNVWAISEDDSHNVPHIGRNRTYLFAPENNHDNIREALMEGRFYSTISADGETPPALTGVTVDEHAGTITLEAEHYSSIRWISMGQEVGNEQTIDLANTPGIDRYVRAELQGPEGRTYTNPFGLTYFINRPPFVSAGPDQTVQVGSVITLTGDAYDDGLPDPPRTLGLQWQQVSGPAEISTSDTDTSQMIASFPEEGTYTLALTADDGEFQSSDEVNVTVIPQQTGWTAYNDVSHGRGQVSENITAVGLDETGELVDFETGSPLGVTIEIINNPNARARNNGTGGPMPKEGTDAYQTFNGKVSFSNIIWYGNRGWWVDAVFTGLNPDHRYEFATSMNRGGGSRHQDRWSKCTISDIDDAKQASTEGVTIFSPTSVALRSGDNTEKGHVARWTNIAPGDNGSFKVRVEAGDGEGMHHTRGYAFDGILLRDLGPAQ